MCFRVVYRTIPHNNPTPLTHPLYSPKPTTVYPRHRRPLLHLCLASPPPLLHHHPHRLFCHLLHPNPPPPPQSLPLPHLTLIPGGRPGGTEVSLSVHSVARGYGGEGEGGVPGWGELTEEERAAVGGKFSSYGRKGDRSYRHWMKDTVNGDTPPNGTSLVKRR